MIPQMGTALLGMGKTFMAGIVSKSPGTGDGQFEIQESFSQMRKVYGTRIPTPPQKLDYITEGMWKWIYWDFYSADTSLKLDDILQDSFGMQYRIMYVVDWNDSGFKIYTLQQVPIAGGMNQ